MEPEGPVIGIVIVDHGSRRLESNEQLHEVTHLFRERTSWTIVEPAHMELAEPSIRAAVDNCVAAGAKHLIVFPWFLARGRHWHQDIPDLVEAAVARHAGVTAAITEPFGIDPAMISIADRRVRELADGRGDVTPE